MVFQLIAYKFRDLIPLLAAHYRVIAPSSWAGFTEVPEARGYSYSFDNLAYHAMQDFVNALKPRGMRYKV